LSAYFDTLYANKIGPEYNETLPPDAADAVRRLNMGEHQPQKKYDPIPVKLSSKENACFSNDDNWTMLPFGRHGPHSISPTVLLGTIYTPRPVLEIDLGDSNAQQNLELLNDNYPSLEAYFVKKFGELPFFEYTEYDVCPYEESFDIEAKEWIEDIANVPGEKVTISTAYAARHLVLTLGKEAGDNKVVPSILLSRHHLESEHTHLTCSGHEMTKFWLHNGNREFYFTPETNTGFTDLFWNGYFDSPYDPLEHICGPLPLSGELSKMVLQTERLSYWKWLHEFDLLELEQESVFKPDFKFEKNIASPYPSNTIMGMLHRHMQSQKPEDSIFGVLQAESEWFCNALHEHLLKIQSNLAGVEQSYKSYFS